jgi:hypothetical protein
VPECRFENGNAFNDRPAQVNAILCAFPDAPGNGDLFTIDTWPDYQRLRRVSSACSSVG